MGVLDGSPAIVTGGGGGIGRGIALAMAAEGAPVAVLGRTEESLLETCNEIEGRGGRALPVVCDVRELKDIEEAVDTVIDRFGGIRILVNNAQSHCYGRLLDVAEEDVDSCWRSAPLAALRLMRACHPHLLHGGAIVNISSGAQASAPAGVGIYAAAKAALQTLSRVAALEWADDGIRVNTILPVALSPGFEHFHEGDPEGYAALLRHIPMHRVGDPERDIGRAAVFLVDPASGYITGATLPVDGGGTYLR